MTAAPAWLCSTFAASRPLFGDALPKAISLHSVNKGSTTDAYDQTETEVLRQGSQRIAQEIKRRCGLTPMLVVSAAGAA